MLAWNHCSYEEVVFSRATVELPKAEISEETWGSREERGQQRLVSWVFVVQHWRRETSVVRGAEFRFSVSETTSCLGEEEISVFYRMPLWSDTDLSWVWQSKISMPSILRNETDKYTERCCEKRASRSTQVLCRYLLPWNSCCPGSCVLSRPHHTVPKWNCISHLQGTTNT